VGIKSILHKGSNSREPSQSDSVVWSSRTQSLTSDTCCLPNLRAVLRVLRRESTEISGTTPHLVYEKVAIGGAGADGGANSACQHADPLQLTANIPGNIRSTLALPGVVVWQEAPKV
jgi:hypothetical protein